VEELIAALHRLTREEGLSTILVEQNARKVLGVTDRVAVLERGSVVHTGDSAALKADPEMLERFLGVGRTPH
jgi:branched-chain amino acid transport system ATP-binding protein